MMLNKYRTDWYHVGQTGRIGVSMLIRLPLAGELYFAYRVDWKPLWFLNRERYVTEGRMGRLHFVLTSPNWRPKDEHGKAEEAVAGGERS